MRLHQLKEGYSILPKMDREKYQERDGLEGPIMTRSGKVVYYDPKQGSYYDPDTDMYISYDDWKKLDSENMHKIDMDEARSKQLHDIQWPDTDEDGDSEMSTHAYNAIRHNFPAHDAYDHVYSMSRERDWLEANKEELIDMFAGYGLPMDWDESVAEDCDCECGEEPCKKCGKTHHEDVNESEDKPYICVHAKKGKHECHASSSYEAAKKAAAHWKMKSTAGIDAHLAVDEGLTDIVKSVGNTFKRGFKSLTNRNNRPAKPPQPNQHTARVKPGRNTNYSGTSIAQKINWGGKFESADSSAMDKALRSIEKTFGGERSAINDQVTAMCRAADMLGNERFKDRAFSVVEQYGINSKQELIQELHMMIKNEAEIDDEEIYGADTNIKMMKNAIAKLRKVEEVTLEALTEEQFDEAAGEKDACYHKVKSRYKVWPSAYASGALVKCRKVGAKNWGNSKK